MASADTEIPKRRQEESAGDRQALVNLEYCQIEPSSAAPTAARFSPHLLMGMASAPSAEQSCMPASSAPTLPRASGSSAPSQL